MAQDLTIVMYHYVRDFARSRYPGIRGLDLAGFRRQLDFLQRNHNIVTMPEVLAALRGDQPLPPDAALLTFDDGYAEHYQLVFPELHKRRLSGCFYAPVAPVRDHRLLDVNRVHFILAATLDNPAQVGAAIDARIRAEGPSRGLDTVEAYRAEWAQPNRFDDAETIYIKRMLQTVLPEDMRHDIARDLFARHVTADEAAFAAELYLSEDQARLMQASGMHFGSHGAEHLWLNRISPEQQAQEIDRSLAFLRDIGVPVDREWVMCYPYGGWNDSLLEVLRARGCSAGLTTEVATARIGHHDPLLLPRFDTNDFPQ
ncbi:MULTISPECIES: polysaccharide deacetylase family protein [unclassified Paracoccus (in: a-proteobacteria)]|uniref:polysaccharide deacetylase family protein n=1 Tax=unclassified Paracoccus (in: a-proteobacteria) TaxID=2688777 RepID=UPI0018A6B421|nr:MULTISPECIES: polysaccharide deacetylase family protein [unclassified Paracoccus (in: a-proteobacteria)]UXU74439.1 polysaccharide deacetylase family protein [Paracoccus sp. SMMA_5]UXU80330.1 polysaccharide deacetylase family protein [Paracoccus sp. SMMA_5_TC]